MIAYLDSNGNYHLSLITEEFEFMRLRLTFSGLLYRESVNHVETIALSSLGRHCMIKNRNSLKEDLAKNFIFTKNLLAAQITKNSHVSFFNSELYMEKIKWILEDTKKEFQFSEIDSEGKSVNLYLNKTWGELKKIVTTKEIKASKERTCFQPV